MLLILDSNLLLAPALHWNQPDAHSVQTFFLFFFIWRRQTVNVITSCSMELTAPLIMLFLSDKWVYLKHFAASTSRLLFILSLTFSASLSISFVFSIWTLSVVKSFDYFLLDLWHYMNGQVYFNGWEVVSVPLPATFPYFFPYFFHTLYAAY